MSQKIMNLLVDKEQLNYNPFLTCCIGKKILEKVLNRTRKVQEENRCETTFGRFAFVGRNTESFQFRINGER